MKILTVVRNPVGGIRTCLKYTYGHFTPGRYDFTFLTTSCNESHELDQLRSDLQSFHARFVEVNGEPVEWRLFNAVRKELAHGSYDLIHSQGFGTGMIVAAANLIARKPHVLTLQNVFLPEEFSAGFLRKLLYSFLLFQTDVIQSVGYDAQQNLVETFPLLKWCSGKLRTIMNGIPISSFANGTSSTGSALKAELGLSGDTVLFGFLGRFMPQKGFQFVIEAVEELAKNDSYRGKFKVLAVNDGGYIREYKADIERKGLARYFVFQGFCPDVQSILTGLDALLMPSIWEAMSLLAMEAFVAGCPLVASDCLGLRETIESTPALRIKARDVKDLSRAMREVVDDRRKFKVNAKNFVEEACKRYDVSETSRRLEKVFAAAVSSDPAL